MAGIFTKRIWQP